MFHYKQIKFHATLPHIENLPPFKAVVLIEREIPDEERRKISAWLVRSGCLYMMAWGEDAATFHDAVDDANLEMFDFGDIPEDQYVMTTWHDDEPVEEVFWFSANAAHHPIAEIKNMLVLHIGEADQRDFYLKLARLAHNDPNNQIFSDL